MVLVHVRWLESYAVAQTSKSSRFVAYYRVSTAQQGRSGLGLDAQREAERAFLAGRADQLAEAFTEIESG